MSCNSRNTNQVKKLQIVLLLKKKYILKGIFNKLSKSHVHYNFDYNLRFNRKKIEDNLVKLYFQLYLKCL